MHRKHLREWNEPCACAGIEILCPECLPFVKDAHELVDLRHIVKCVDSVGDELPIPDPVGIRKEEDGALTFGLEANVKQVAIGCLPDRMELCLKKPVLPLPDDPAVSDAAAAFLDLMLY